MVLRSADGDLGADLDGVSLDREAAACGVDVSDAERDRLPPADPGLRENKYDTRRVAGLAGETIDLPVGEVEATAHDLALGLHPLGRVRDDAPVVDGVVEDRLQDAVDPLDRGGRSDGAGRCEPVLDRCR